MKLIIAGGRFQQMSLNDRKELKIYIKRNNVKEIVQGGATGIDEAAKRLADELNIKCIEFAADWDTHKRAAGPIRNKQMAAYGDVLMLFPGGKGSQSMYSHAKTANIDIIDLR